MNEPWILWVLGAVLAFVVIPMVALAIHYYRLGRWAKKSLDNLIDPTGTPLTPSFHGKDCLGNGEHPGIECCCDECDHYRTCFPDCNQ